MIKQYKYAILAAMSAFSLLNSLTVIAEPSIKLFSNKYGNAHVSMEKITQLVNRHFDVNQYRQVKVQVIYNEKQQPSHLLVYLFSKKFHHVEIARMNLDPSFNSISVINPYRLSQQDLAQQPGITINQAQCPDPSVEFIAFAPNDWDLEQNITIDVANAAEAHSLKTVRLLKEEATRTNYLNYMKCPQLKGNFYDGDADTEVIITVDGVISYEDINTELRNQFQYKVTNIWLACEAYNDPIKTSLLDIAQSQKYAAGINNLIVGPSDQAAACTMKAAFEGKPMTTSFQACYAEYDTAEDQWGFGGKGSDFFGA